MRLVDGLLGRVVGMRDLAQAVFKAIIVGAAALFFGVPLIVIMWLAEVTL